MAAVRSSTKDSLPRGREVPPATFALLVDKSRFLNGARVAK